MENVYSSIFKNYTAVFNKIKSQSVININDYYADNSDYKEQVKLFIESFDPEIFENELGRFEHEEKSQIKNDFFCKMFDIVFKIRAGELYSPYKEIFSEMIKLTLEEKLYYENLSDIYDFLPELSENIIKKDKEYLFDPFILFLQKNNTYIRSDYEINLFKELLKDDLMNVNLENVESNGFRESIIFKTLVRKVNDIDNEKKIDTETLLTFINKGWILPSENILLDATLYSNKPELLQLVIKHNLVDINAPFEISNDDGETTVEEHVIDYYKSRSNYHSLSNDEREKIDHMFAILFDNGLQLDLMHQGYLTTLAHLTDKIYEKMNVNVNIFQEYNPVFIKQQDYTGMNSNIHENALDYFIGDSQIKTAKALYDNQRHHILIKKEDTIRLIEKSLMVFEHDNINAIFIYPLSEDEILERNDFALTVFHDYQDLFSEKEIEQLLLNTVKSPIQGGFNSRLEKEIISNGRIMANDNFKNKVNRL